MITYVLGSFFSSPAGALVNTVNTTGVMGKGIAKVFREAFPEMFAAYRNVCESRSFGVGDLILYPTPHKSVLNFPTKTDWRRPSRLEQIEAGLRTFAESYASRGLTSVAFPQLGCGNGGLDWEREVRPLMESTLAPLPIQTYIHIYDDRDHLPIGWDAAYLKRWLQSLPAPITTNDVWQELSRIAATSHHSAESGTSVSIADQCDDGVEVLVFTAGEDALYWARDDFLTWWPTIAEGGIVTASRIDAVVGGWGETVLSALVRLPRAHRIWCAGGGNVCAAPVVWGTGVQLLPDVGEGSPTHIRVRSADPILSGPLQQSVLPLSVSSHAA